MLVRRDAAGVRLFTRNGHDWTWRFPLNRAGRARSRLRFHRAVISQIREGISPQME